MHISYNQSQKLFRIIIYPWKSPKKMLDLFKDIHNSSSSLVQCLAKSRKTMPDCGDQEWLNKLTTNTE